MIKATKPTSPLFTSELDTFSFSIGGDSATVTITCAGEELLSETYYPVSGNITIYDLGTLIADAVRPTVIATFSISITEHTGETETASWSSGSITAYYATVDIDMSAATFLDRYFMSLLDGAKLTRLGHREYLHAAGSDSTKAIVTARYIKNANTVNTATFTADVTPTRTVNGITTFDVSPDRYHNEVYGDLFAYTVTVGKRTQEFQIDHTGSVADPVLLFTNSFGCQETFYCLGKKKDLTRVRAQERRDLRQENQLFYQGDTQLRGRHRHPATIDDSLRRRPAALRRDLSFQGLLTRQASHHH